MQYGRDIRGPLRYVAPSVTAMLTEVVSGPGIEHLGAHDRADQPLVQQLYLNDADTVDLAALHGFPALKEVSVNRAARITGGLAHLPALETPSSETGEVDVDAFAGHRRWRLELKVLKHPVDLAQLAALPSLVHLDVSGVETTGLESGSATCRTCGCPASPEPSSTTCSPRARRSPARRPARRTPHVPGRGRCRLEPVFPEREAPWHVESSSNV
ncbi:hypothetical protein AB0F91_10185 [Amycolatopsis sp. NPDC023774]|uniref:hypothetical protein n=1 Tax=Amycolatopsis sp. NPDC023774 TaxID=3155015 RepID=UPI0033EE2CE6